MKKTVAFVLSLLVALGCVFALCACAPQEGTLIVYTESGFAPFEYVSQGKIVGVDVDIMALVGEKLGKKVVFENVDFSTIVDAVSEGKLTNVGAAGISVTEARKEKVDFSKEYYTASLYVVYKTADAAVYESDTTDGCKGVYWDSLAGKNIAVQEGTTADLFLGDELSDSEDYHGILYETGAARVGFAQYATALADIGLNSDVIVMDELPAQMLIKGKSEFSCAPLYYMGDEETPDDAAVDVYAICVTKGQTELLDAINAVLTELGEEGIQKLVNKHLGFGD